MGIWRRIRFGIRALVHRRDADRDLADEVRHYMEEAEADLVRRGATPEEARRAARLRYGDGLAAREDVRGYGWEGWVQSVASDLRLGARSLRRSPGFTTVAVLTLGLGIGASTAIFSAVRPVLFEPLAYPHAERILSLGYNGDGGAVVPSTFGTYLEVVRRSRAFQSLSVSKPWQPTLTGDAEPQRLSGQSVSAGYFDVLGVRPALGPGFDASEDRPGGARLVILSNALWRARFDADPGLVGRLVRLDGDPYTVVGVMPASFENVTAPRAQVWTLLQYDPALAGFESREWGHHLAMMGRLRPGAGLDEARQDLDAVARRPLPDFPRPDWASMARGFSVRRLRDATTADARPMMLVFLGAVGLLVLVTSANLTLLLLARGSRRRSEFAMRVALGAGRGRLARYLLTESLLLSTLGGVLGIVLARAGLAALLALSPPSLPRLDAIRLYGVPLAFALVVTTLVGVIFGLAPGLHRSGGRPQAIREAGRGSAGRRRSTSRFLVVAEVGMAVVLLVGAGLLVRSTQQLFSEPLGFDARGLVVMQVYGTSLEHGDAVTHRFFDQALDAVRAVPGVVSAVASNQVPLNGDLDLDTYGVTRADAPSDDDPGAAAYRYAVSPEYFETMGIHVTRGRGLRLGDNVSGAPHVAVVSERLARRLFPEGNAVGGRIQVGPAEPEPYTIVGVVDDVKQASLEAEGTETVYMTSHQWHWADRVRWMVVRAEGNPVDLVPTIRRAIWSVDGDQPVVRAGSMESVVLRSEARRRFVLMVITAFALAAMTLAVVGLYGVVAGMVSERLPEMGVRAALGASRERIVAMVVRQGMALALTGVVLGVLGSLAATGLLSTLLFRVSRLDPVTYVAVVLLLASAAALASWLPALRAARVDPVRSLKAE